MKSSAHLYLPWSVIAEWLGTSKGHLPAAAPEASPMPVVFLERLEGGCVLYRLRSREGTAHGKAG
jgi:hypothetical protein